MVLRLKTWESRSPPGLPSTQPPSNRKIPTTQNRSALSPPKRPAPGGHHPKQQAHNAGWSSPVARQAHNLKVAGSNPAPATNKAPSLRRGFVGFRRPGVGSAGSCGSGPPHNLKAEGVKETLRGSVSSPKVEHGRIARAQSAQGQILPPKPNKKPSAKPEGFLGFRRSAEAWNHDIPVTRSVMHRFLFAKDLRRRPERPTGSLDHK